MKKFKTPLEMELWQIIDGTLHPIPNFTCKGCPEVARRIHKHLVKEKLLAARSLTDGKR